MNHVYIPSDAGFCPYCHGYGSERLANGDGTATHAKCTWCDGKNRRAGESPEFRREMDRLQRMKGSVI